MFAYHYAILAAGYVLWFLPFPLNRWSSKAPSERDRRGRWGIVLQMIGYSVLWQSPFWMHHPAPWRVALSVLFLALAAIISWSSTRALGRHLRFDAALDADHQLVRSGPYRSVRHPIYASMLALFLGTAAMISTLPLFLIGLAIFLAGTEIRVRVEDRMLAARFTTQFAAYRQSVSAYIPFVR